MGIIQGYEYAITNDPYKLLHFIVEHEGEKAYKRRNDVSPSTYRSLFYDSIYLGTQVNDKAKIRFPKPIKNNKDNEVELDESHRNRIRMTYRRLNSRKVMEILCNKEEWEKFCHCKEVVYSGLGTEKLKERHPYVQDDEFRERISKIYENVIKQYEVYSKKIEKVKLVYSPEIERLKSKIEMINQELDIEITKLITEIEGE